MSLPFFLRVGTSFVVLAFGLATFALLGGSDDAIALTLWLTSPQLLALFIVLAARDKRKQSTAAAAIVLFCIAGMIVLPSGGAPGLFLPVWELLLLGLTLFAVSLVSQSRR